MEKWIFTFFYITGATKLGSMPS